MAVPLVPYIQYFDSNGNPRAGGKVYTYAANTTTPKATYTAADGITQAANPITLNSAGMPDHGSGNVGMIWIQGAYDFVVTNADGTDPITVRNETSFNTISPAGASFFQTWSGDGTTTTFPLSQPLGTDENAVLLFVDNGLPNYVTNGDFATDTIWTKGAGWTIGSGVATATGAISTAISQTANATLIQGQSYTVTYTVTVSAGSIVPAIGGQTGPTAHNASGTFSETITAGATQLIAFTGTGFTGTLDNVSVKPTQGSGRQVVYPTEFTLNNTSFTLATPPKAGTNNIAMFSFSTLVAAASASAAAAEAFALAANVSAGIAASQATSFTGTSTTSVLIATGSQIFTTQTNKNFIPGEFLTIASGANPANYMYGQVTSYVSLTGVLTVNVTTIGGSGTFADWNIALSGQQGVAGGAVANGTYGDVVVTGGGTIWTIGNGAITFPKLATAAVATQAEMEAETASKLAVASLLKYHPGVAKAWVNFNGNGGAVIRASYNVSSTTRNSAGDYTVNFSTAMSSINYVVVPAGATATTVSANVGWAAKFGNLATTSFRITTGNDGTTTTTLNDSNLVTAVVFGDL